MNSVFKFATFIVFIITAVQSNKTKNVKVFKLNEKIIYDCVDIYKQPSLSHPLLQNHKIQMEPSFSISKPKKKSKRESKSESIIQCPNGTVPILRNTKEYVADAQYWEEKHFNLSALSQKAYFAGVRITDNSVLHGLAAWMSVHELNITSNDQASFTNIYVTSKIGNDKIDGIQTGWMVNPGLFGDGRTWTYGFWKGANGAGCYNTKCPGFVQVSKTDPLSVPIPKGQEAIHISLQQDNESGHWWTTHVIPFDKDIHVGYWPKELFDNMSNGVNIVGVTGAVMASPSGISPPMGNGHFPDAAAGIKHLETVDYEFIIQDSNKYKLETVVEANNQCYRLKYGKRVVSKESNLFPFGLPGAGSNKNLFTYGGPGGNSC